MDLFKAAIDVRSNAYAPYSNFQVGAAIRSVSGNLYVGSTSKTLRIQKARVQKQVRSRQWLPPEKVRSLKF